MSSYIEEMSRIKTFLIRYASSKQNYKLIN